MPVIPTAAEIPLYVNDHGKVSCHIGDCDWDPSQMNIGRRMSLLDLAEGIREHALTEHLNELGR